MATKKKWQIWEETPIRFGVYKNNKNGKLAIARPSKESGWDYEIDKGVKKRHPIFNIKVSITEQGTGNYFFNKSLNNYEWVDELPTGITEIKLGVKDV